MNIHNRVILDFNASQRDDDRFQDLRMQVYCDTRIKGLAILNPGDDCGVSNFMVRNETFIQASKPVPGKFFAYPNVKSLEDLKKRVIEYPELAPVTSWIGNKVVTCGHNVSVQIQGKFDAVIAWGDSVQYANPMHDIKITPCEIGKDVVTAPYLGVKAELRVRRWDDEEWNLVMEVCTLSEQGALTLIQSELQKYNRMFHG